MVNDMYIGRFILAHFLICIYLVNITFTDCIERYLADYNYLNPFIIIIAEGIFEIFMTTFYMIGKEPFKDMKKQYEKKEPLIHFTYIFFVFIFIIFSGIECL